ncbi:exocyst complex component 6B-like [Platysternon megacephalum]|uniref:Exocyst complex component 6B-like n=1 Tax=Platysternon megacephalum TaxID=55544 RepID=A0A4D9EW96_9SAUR|nr:exocyst complex component 6B-like [Platysternon megacephalum]
MTIFVLKNKQTINCVGKTRPLFLRQYSQTQNLNLLNSEGSPYDFSTISFNLGPDIKMVNIMGKKKYHFLTSLEKASQNFCFTVFIFKVACQAFLSFHSEVMRGNKFACSDRLAN